MKPTLTGNSFPDYRLVYSNDGDTLVGTRSIFNPEFGTSLEPQWSTDGEAITVAGASNGQYAGLALATNIHGLAFVLQFDAFIPPSSTPYGSIGLGISNPDVMLDEMNYNDVSNSARLDLNVGAFGYTNWVLAYMDGTFPESEWFTTTYEIVGGLVSVWHNGEYVGSTIVFGDQYYLAGKHGQLRISASCRTVASSPLSIKNIRAWAWEPQRP